MPWLKDLVCPCHRDGHSGSKAESHKQEATVPRPWVGDAARISGHEQSRYLDADWDAEEERTVMVESIGEGCYKKNCDQIHLANLVNMISVIQNSLAYYPDGSREQAELDPSQFRIRCSNYDGSIVLNSNAYSDDPKVHHEQRP